MKAIIPAAGQGTRMQPLTFGISKEMIPVGEFPLIHHTIEEIPFNVPVIVVTHPSKTDLLNYLAHMQETYFWNIQIVFQLERNGLSDAVRKVNHLMNDEWAYIALPDELFLFYYFEDQNLFNFMTSTKPSILSISVERMEMHNYGMIEITDDGNIDKIVEKPTDSVIQELTTNLASVGRYVIPYKDFVEYFDNYKEIAEMEPMQMDQIPEFNFLLNEMIENKDLNLTVKNIKRQFRFDCGNMEGYRKALLTELGGC